MGKLFCFRWFKTEKSKRESFGGIKEGSRGPKLQPHQCFQTKEKHTHTNTHTRTPHHCVFKRKFSLVTWSGKHLPQLVSTIFFHVQVSELQGNWVVYTQPPCTCLRTSTTWNIICYIKYIKCETTTDDVNSGPWFPNCQTGWNGIYSIQVKFI